VDIKISNSDFVTRASKLKFKLKVQLSFYGIIVDGSRSITCCLFVPPPLRRLYILDTTYQSIFTQIKNTAMHLFKKIAWYNQYNGMSLPSSSNLKEWTNNTKARDGVIIAAVKKYSFYVKSLWPGK